MKALSAMWRRSDHVSSPAPTPRSLHSWRVATAVRVFALALVIGQLVNKGAVGQAGLVLLGLAIVGAACIAVELHGTRSSGAWVSLAEGVMVSLLIGNAGSSVEPVMPYLAVPAVVAGVRYGRLATANTSLLGMLTLCASEATAHQDAEFWSAVSAALTWLAIGVGAGLLAAAQTRSLRQLEAAQAPYAAAHRLVGQLHTLARDLPVALDVATHARAVQDCTLAAFGAERTTVLVLTSSGALESLVPPRTMSPSVQEVARRCFASGRILRRSGALALPLRVGDQIFGAAVVEQGLSLAHKDLSAVQEQVDELAIRLQTALLIDDVRSMATTEERNRLAREIHDGVAQRIVSLGYLAEEIAALCDSSAAQQVSEDLRGELTDLVGELRFSIFDLRHDVEDDESLSGALAEYVRELGAHSDLRVHLTLDERGARLPRRTEGELLRIAQEALGNVHKHASAINVWVRLAVNGDDVCLVVEDDGVGGASPRTGHYGLETMQERAQRVNADLEVAARNDGGTVVTLRSRSAVTITEGTPRHVQRLARR